MPYPIDPIEPTVRVGPYTLKTAEASTVRVAHRGHVIKDVETVEDARKCYRVLHEFKARLERDGLGEDEVGRDICRGYIHHAGMVMSHLKASFESIEEAE